MQNKILFIDTETGGTNPSEASLLSIGLAVWDNKEITYKKEIFIKNEIYKVTTSAMRINKIDILEIDKVGINQADAIRDIEEICKTHFDELPITIGGHNINFDVNFIRHLMSTNNYNFNSLFSHRYIDTSSIIQYLYHAGKLPVNICSSDEAFEYYKISTKSRHSSLSDCIATAELFNKLVDTIKKG